MTILFLIRHGQNDWVGKRLVGRSPGVHLNEAGRAQATTLAHMLSAIPIKAIYSSPLERAVETAEPLAKQLSIDITTRSGLQEIDFGLWQGKTIKQLRRMKLWKTVQEEPEKMCFPGGESFQQAQERLATCIGQINDELHEDDMAACFSHADSIRIAIAHFLGLPLSALQRLAIDTASVSVLVFHKGKVFVPYINQVLTTPFTEAFSKREESPSQKTKKK